MNTLNVMEELLILKSYDPWKFNILILLFCCVENHLIFFLFCIFTENSMSKSKLKKKQQKLSRWRNNDNLVKIAFNLWPYKIIFPALFSPHSINLRHVALSSIVSIPSNFIV